jgi:hypothetical protein
MRFQFAGLPVGHPERRAITLGHGRIPKQKDVDATVGGAVVTARDRNAAFGTAGFPRLQPGTDAGFQVGNDPIGDAGVNVSARGGRIAHDVISFQGSGAVHMHMHRCPSARSGVAKRQGRGAGRGITRLAQAQRGKLGKRGPAAELHPCAARGAEPLRDPSHRCAHGVAVDTVRARSLLQADAVEHGPRAVAPERWDRLSVVQRSGKRGRRADACACRETHR